MATLQRPRRLTLEERQLARAQAAEAAAAAEKAALEEMRADLPRRLFTMKKMAETAGVRVTPHLTELGFAVVFEMPFGEEEMNFWTTEPWQVDSLERRLQELLAEQEATRNRRNLAFEALGGLTEAQLAAMKEFKDELFHR